jgi:hypothetical protein
MVLTAMSRPGVYPSRGCLVPSDGRFRRSTAVFWEELDRLRQSDYLGTRTIEIRSGVDPG